MTTTESIQREIAALSDREIAVETNSGTYGPREAHRLIGTGDPAFADYTVYERVGGGRRVVGCDPERAPGRARRINAVALAAARQELATLHRRLRETSRAEG